ncbi:YchJ family metal-binding protein [Trueperella sp.]|uniref:YchJ family metal-binding protein n=1 Tax=Trueperella sp. TaxID=2699835 RepID=UPI0022EA4D65|nr:YchJ family metal-binding protein [Trueperella sp.]
MSTAPCPYGVASLAACCGPYLDASVLPPTAKATMRSRCSAFATGNSAHLFRTWHPRTRPSGEKRIPPRPRRAASSSGHERGRGCGVGDR